MQKETHKKNNTTKYGEFVCSTFQWLPIEKQKSKAKNMSNITKSRKSLEK